MTMAPLFFDLFMLPLERLALHELRKKVIPLARGKVLELGAGTGINLKYYRQKELESLTLTDLELDGLVEKRAKGLEVPLNYQSADAQALMFPDASFDTVVFTLVFCSVPLPEEGFREIFRVLKPGGRLLFIEHVLSHHPGLARMQHRLTPGWRRIAGNCHLNRNTEEIILQSGFTIREKWEKGRGILLAGAAVKPESV